MHSLLALVTLVFGVLVSISNVQTQSDFSPATTKFSIDLLKQVFAEGNDNVISSPVSLSTLLAILLQGAGHSTEMQLVDVLHMKPQQAREGFSKLIGDYKSSTDNATLEFANGLFLNQAVKLIEDFKKTVENDFKAQEYSVDFSNQQKAADTINSWASDNTHGLIDKLFEPDQIPGDTVCILTNAIYFKSFWKSRFDKKITQPLPFHTLEGGEVQVPTMNLKANYITGEIKELQSKWIEVPYEGPQYSFLIVMPTDVNGFDNLQKQFTDQHFSSILQSIKADSAQEVILHMPKFTLTSDLNNLVDTLQKLGLTDIFGDNSDLPGITGQALKVDKVVQKAKIIVDEEGSEAAAVTGIIGVDTITSVGAFTPEFRVDRPFLFFILDKTNSIPLFAGRVTDPTK